MAEKKPFSNEELQGFTQGNFRLTKKFSGEIVANWIDRFLDTIDEYKAAMDSAMRQVSSLNEGNIADRKRIEELEKQAEIKDSLAEGVMTLADVHEQLQDAEATVERLRGDTKLLISTIKQGRLASIGSIENTYCPQIGKDWLEKIETRQALDERSE